MIVFPNCKINLGLHILNKREDSFHNIETILYPVRWCDALEAIPSEEFSFRVEGGKIEGSPEDNLCVKAFRLLEKELGIPPVKMCLLKNIPTGAGLGGGSSDAAFTLKLLNDLFELKLSADQLKHFASQLGSDCTFFVDNKPCLATGRGNELRGIDVDLSSHYITIVYPNIKISTAWAYAKSKPVSAQAEVKSLVDILKLPVNEWKGNLQNDFEEIVFKEYPEIASVKNMLYENGALYSSMSGSGSSVFGIFKEEKEISFAASYNIFRGKL